MLFTVLLLPAVLQAGWTSAPPSTATVGASTSVSANGQANSGYAVSYLVIWVQSPSGSWTPVATGTGANLATINCSGSKTLDAAGTWNWSLRLQTSGPSGSPSGTQLSSGSTTVSAPTTAVSFSFSNLTHTYDGNLKTASVTPNPGNATYTADLTKGPDVGNYTVSASGTGSFVGSGSATLTINAAPDTTPPSTPTNVRVTAFDQSSVTFAWDAATDNVGVTGYLVRLNQGSPMFVTGLSHTFSGLSNNTNYLLEVSARDASSNSSGWGGASASTGSSGGGGSGSGQSLWADVNADGILDEVVKAGTSDFSYAVDWWYTSDPNGWNIQVNAFWNPFSIFNPGSGAWWNDHVSIWRGELSITPVYRNTTTLGVTLTINPRPGRQMAIYKDPTGSNTLIPAVWEVIQPHMGPIAQSPFSYTQIFYSAGSLDGTAIYLAHLGAPVANMQFRDSTGSALTDSIAVNGTTNLFLPTNNQVTLNLTNSFGGVIDSAHQIVWQIRDTLGNVLRQGLGINVSFDNLNLAQIARIVIFLDNASEKEVTVNPIFIDVDDGQKGVIGDFVISETPQSTLKHFVTPKKTPALNQDYVILKVFGISAADFQSNYSWDGAGEAVPNEPLKRRVSRAAASRNPVSVKRANAPGNIVASTIVWVVWCEGSRALGTSFDSFVINDILHPAHQSWRFAFTIYPTEMINPVNGSEIPLFKGYAETLPPGYSGSLEHQGKWDVSRQMRVIHSNAAPTTIQRSQISPAPGAHEIGLNAVNPSFPRALVEVVSFPSGDNFGNDDLATDDEDNDPYPNGYSPGLSGIGSVGIGVIASEDTPRFPGIQKNAGVSGETLLSTARFREFARLEIGYGSNAKWYRISDYLLWSYFGRFRRTESIMVDDGSNMADGH